MRVGSYGCAEQSVFDASVYENDAPLFSALRGSGSISVAQKARPDELSGRAVGGRAVP